MQFDVLLCMFLSRLFLGFPLFENEGNVDADVCFNFR